MKTTRILVMTLVMSIFCAAGLYAQAQQGQKSKLSPEERVAKRVEMMKQSLNLTDDQVAKVKDAQTQLFNDIQQIRGNCDSKGKGTGDAKDAKSKATSDEMKAKRAAIQAKKDAYDAQLKTILTPEQYQKYQDLQKDWQKKGHGKMQNKTKEG